MVHRAVFKWNPVNIRGRKARPDGPQLFKCRLGLLRFAEAALQVMGKAGAHQVAGARTALGHAYGGGSQYFSMWVVGSEKPE